MTNTVLFRLAYATNDDANSWMMFSNLDANYWQRSGLILSGLFSETAGSISILWIPHTWANPELLDGVRYPHQEGEI